MLLLFSIDRSPITRDMGRAHRVAVAWLRELYTSGGVNIAYASSDGNAADIFTKAFRNAQKPKREGPYQRVYVRR